MLGSFVNLFASRPKRTLGLWVALLAFGVVAYTLLLPREGFPSVDIPATLVNGQYFVDDAEKVDADVAQPLSDALTKRDEVVEVQTFSAASNFAVFIELETQYSSADGAAIIDEEVAALNLPPEAQLDIKTIDAAKYLEEFDLLVGVYGPVDASAEELESAAAEVLADFEDHVDIDRVEVVPLIRSGTNPTTGEEESIRTNFNQLGVKNGDSLEVRPAITIGVVASDDVDTLGIQDATNNVLNDLEGAGAYPEGFGGQIAVDFGTQIRQQIGSLESNVLTGIVAVAAVALVIISWRASIITALFIATVLATTLGILFLIGISLNTISLFGVILALGLFVDDAIVITEAIVAFREESEDDNPLTIIRNAIKRVGGASVSGTLTTVLVFAPMLFITGILGDFIKILPITVMISLTVSLLLSLIFIPVAARFLLLKKAPKEGLTSRIEDKLARAIAAPAGVRGWPGAAVGVSSVILAVGMAFIGLTMFAPNVGFDIFPQAKDSIELELAYDLPVTMSADEAEPFVLEQNQKVADALGPDLERFYYSFPQLDTTPKWITLTPVGTRKPVPELIETVLNPVADESTNADGEPQVKFSQLSAGPPAEEFPFKLQVYGEDIDALKDAATEIAKELEGAEVESNGSTFTVTKTQVDFTEQVVRFGGKRLVEVQASFDTDETTSATTATKDYVLETFTADRLAELGLSEESLEFDFGFESDNQESFSSLPYAFLTALGLMMVLLIVQFRSAIQWLLVFLAIPFSFYGVFGGLLLTNNVISFFVMLGLIGLVGIAVNNTILLTDFANQERRAGHDARTSVQNALRRRFRPLVATTLTTVAGILPLALSDPFWEALGMTIIFGLLSSTFLVLVSFPYFYLASEAITSGFKTAFGALRGAVQTARQGQ